MARGKTPSRSDRFRNLLAHLPARMYKLGTKAVSHAVARVDSTVLSQVPRFTTPSRCALARSTGFLPSACNRSRRSPCIGFRACQCCIGEGSWDHGGLPDKRQQPKGTGRVGLQGCVLSFRPKGLYRRLNPRTSWLSLLGQVGPHPQTAVRIIILRFVCVCDHTPPRYCFRQGRVGCSWLICQGQDTFSRCSTNMAVYEDTEQQLGFLQTSTKQRALSAAAWAASGLQLAVTSSLKRFKRPVIAPSTLDSSSEE